MRKSASIGPALAVLFGGVSVVVENIPDFIGWIIIIFAVIYFVYSSKDWIADWFKGKKKRRYDFIFTGITTILATSLTFIYLYEFRSSEVANLRVNNFYISSPLPEQNINDTIINFEVSAWSGSKKDLYLVDWDLSIFCEENIFLGKDKTSLDGVEFAKKKWWTREQVVGLRPITKWVKFHIEDKLSADNFEDCTVNLIAKDSRGGEHIKKVRLGDL